MSTAPRAPVSVLTPARSILAAGLVAVLVGFSISRTIPFDSDEANHANIALRQLQDLARDDFMDFLRHSYRTGQFPFFHGWTIVPFFAALGADEFSARLPQCLHFVVGAAATALAAWRACGDHRRAGGLAGALFALSPMLAVFAGLCMLETPGAAATAVALFCFGEAIRESGARGRLWDAATALAVLATWFTKLNYGMWVLPAIGLGYLVAALRSETRQRALCGLAVWGGVLLVALGAWYATPEQRAAFHGFLTNPAQAVSVVPDDPSFRLPGFRWDNFAGYFPILAGEYHVHWTVGAAVLALFAAGVWGAVRDRNPALIAAAACALWTWLSLSMGFREYPLNRFIAPALPAFWIVAAAGARPLLDRIGNGTFPRLAERAVLLVWLTTQALLVQRLLPLEYEVGTEFRPFFAHVVARLEGPASVLLVNCTDHTSPRTLSWELSHGPGRTYLDWDVKDAGAERIYESTRNLDVWMAEPRRWGGERWRSYVVEIVPGPNTPDAAAIVEPTVRMWADAVRAHVRSGRLEKVDDRPFPGLDLRVRIWRDRTPPPHLGVRGGG